METLIVFILTLELILGQQFDLTEVNYNVNVENGETVVTVPLPFPKGVKSLQPKISLSYRSNQYLTNREIGLGWYFSDFIEISRCPKSYYFDNGFNPIKNDYTDVFFQVELMGIMGLNTKQKLKDIKRLWHMELKV